jgi:hypothetical protein
MPVLTAAYDRHGEEAKRGLQETTHLTDTFSQQYLNDEYVQLCRELTATLCRKRPSPLARGKAATLDSPYFFFVAFVFLA